MTKEAKRAGTAIIAAMALLLFVQLALAFDTSTASYSADSFHHGLSGGDAETATYNSRSTLTHEQGGDDEAATASYAFNAGWLGQIAGQAASNNATINSVECSNNTANYYPCTAMLYGMTITKIRTNCTTTNGTITDVRFTLRNIDDSTDYISNAAYTYNATDSFILNASYLVQDSGSWKLTTTCSVSNGNGTNTDAEYTNWTLPWGWVNASLVQPTADMQAELNKQFTFQTKLSCYAGECGTADATLDPQDCVEEYICTNETSRMCSNNTEGVEECIEVPFENCRYETICEGTQEEPPVIEFIETNIPTEAKLGSIFEVNTTVRCVSESCGNIIIGLDPMTTKPGLLKRAWNYIKYFFAKASITGFAAGELVPTEYDEEHAFYTLDQNPVVNDCLTGMKQGEECTVSWRVNTTGMPGTTAEFYIIANATLGEMTQEFESPHTTLTITGRVWKIAAGTVYTATQDIYEGTKLLGKKRYTNSDFDTHFIELNRTENGLKVIFFHDNADPLTIWVDGAVQYTIDKNTSSFMEPVTLEVIQEEGVIPKFWLVIGEGENKEMFEFGKRLPEMDTGSMIYTIKDRDDTKLDVKLIKGLENVRIEGIEGRQTVKADMFTPNESWTTTDIVAVSSFPMEEATITLEKRGDTTAIYKCDDDKFDYSTGQCLGWARTSIEFLESAIDITFTVDHFTAYAGGNLTNNDTGYLTIWDENDPGMPDASQHRTIGQRVIFFADYRASQNGTKITDANCTISFSDNQTGDIIYNTTYSRYAYNRSFAEPASYSYTISCSHAAYPTTSATDTIPVSSAASKTGAVPTTPGAAPFYTTSSNPQPCNAQRAGMECLSTWQVNTTGTIGTMHTFFTIYNMTSNTAHVADNQTVTVQILITANDTEPPRIRSTNIAPRTAYTGQLVKMYSPASDNMQLGSCYANITRPDSTTVRLDDVCKQQQSYTTTQTGRHNITFFVNDTSGNSATATDQFDVFAPFSFIVTTNYSNGSLQTELTMINPVTGETVNMNETNGTYTTTIPNINYNLLFEAFNNRFRALLRDINISAENNKTFGMDRLPTPVEDYLVSYGILSNFTMSNATLKIYYDDLNFSDEASLLIYKCDDWDFTAQTCNGTWTDITGQSTQDDAENYFETTTTSFSGFSIGEKAAQASQGGGMDFPETTEICMEQWTCSAWSKCTDERQTRECHDLNNCGTSTYGPSTERPCLPSCTPAWECTAWSACVPTGRQTRECEDKNGCKILKGRPETARQCSYDFCNDGRQDNSEAGIDCGGRCKACKTAPAPIAEAPRIIQERRISRAMLVYLPFLTALILTAIVLYLRERREDAMSEKKVAKTWEKKR